MATFSLHWLGLMLDSTAKSLLLAAIAAVSIRALRVRNCHVRHRIWIGVLAGMLVLPFLSGVIPQLPLPIAVPPSWLLSAGDSGSRALIDSSSEIGTSQAVAAGNSRTATDRGQVRSGPEGMDPGVSRFPEPGPRLDGIEASITAADAEPLVGNVAPTPSLPASAPHGTGSPLLQQLPQWLAALWLIGAALMLTRLLLGMLATRQLRRASMPITSADLHELGVSEACWPSGVRPAGLFECPCIRVPLTLGLFRPAVLLPAEWLEWSTGKLESVLLHEGTHVERGDSAIAFLSELNVAMNWFNPLAWCLRHHLSTLAEEACDDAAIAGIGDRRSYARHLLEVAAAVSTTGRILPLAVSMARQSNVESRIDAILDFTRPLSKRPTWTTTLAVLILAGPMIALAAALKPGTPQDVTPAPSAIGESASSVPAPTRFADASSEQKVDSTKAGKDQASTGATGDPTVADHFRYAGTVVDDKGQPVEGARIMLSYWRFRNDEKEPAFATTDARGRFEMRRQKSDFNDSAEDKPWTWAQIVATKPGYGFTSAPSVSFETTGQVLSSLSDQYVEFLKSEGSLKDRVLKLGLDLPIRGRIIDTEGRPVSGALVEPFNASEGRNGSLDAWEAATKERGANYYSVQRELRRLHGGDFVNGPIDRTLPTAKTDADGVFTLRGVGRERLVTAVLSGPNIESSILHLRSRAGETIRLSDSDSGGGGRFFTYHPTEFTHVAGPSQAVEGIVTDLKTGKPVAGLFVRGERTATYNVGGNAGFIRSTTDKDGRYRLEGFPLGTNQFVVLPTAESGYLAASVEVKTTAGTEPLLSNVSVTPAIRARGVIREAFSEKPIRGYVQYFAFAANPALKETRNFWSVDQRNIFPIDAEGSFEIPVLPGPGVITFSANDHESFPRGEGADKIKAPTENPGMYATQPYFIITVNYHGLIPIEPAVGTDSIDVSLTLTRLQSFKGRILAEDGKVVDKYVLYGERAPANWYEHNSVPFGVNGYQPTYGRRLMAYDPVADAVGLLDVMGDAPSNVEIKLRSAARIRGRVVDDEGQPMAGLRIDNDLGGGSAPSPSSSEELWQGKFAPERAEFVDIPGHPILTDDEGRFELVGVLPGLKYSARVHGTQKVGNESFPTILGSIFDDVVARPGEKLNLGDVKITQPKPRMRPKPKPATTPEKSTKESAKSVEGAKPGAAP